MNEFKTAGHQRRDSIVDEAAHWLAMCSDPSATDEEREQFVGWLRRSNLHVEEFLRLSALTQHMASSAAWPNDPLPTLIAAARKGDSPLFPFPGRERAAAPQTPPRAVPKMGKGDCPLFLAAAVLVLAIGAGVFAFKAALLEPEGETYTTAVGELRSVVLGDGSVVDLNTRSTLRTRFTEQMRLVQLESGEAIFKVAKDAARPFHVVAGDTEVVAVGTQFNVYAEQARTVVTVLEGRVQVSDRKSAPARMELGSGEQAVIEPHQPIARVALADPARVTAWTERRLIFEETTLASVASQFARYSPRIIRIGNTSLAQRQITGVFDASDPASLVQFLGAQGDISVQPTEEGWLLK